MTVFKVRAFCGFHSLVLVTKVAPHQLAMSQPMYYEKYSDSIHDALQQLSLHVLHRSDEQGQTKMVVQVFLEYHAQIHLSHQKTLKHHLYLV